METAPQHKWRTYRHRLRRHLQKKMAAGLLVAIPLGITLITLRFLFNLADGVLAPVMRGMVAFLFGKGFYIPGLGIISALVIVYLLGILATNVFGRPILLYWDRLLTRIPLVNTIYVTSKQLMDVFRHRGRSSFQRAVYVDFPKEGSYAIAFITNETVNSSGKRHYTCFVPSSPNPTSGYVLLLKEEEVYPTSLSVEEAMKFIMSGGMVVPEVVHGEKPGNLTSS
jgi:uncharacterized membrane protein